MSDATQPRSSDEQQQQSGAEDDRRRFGRRVNRAAPPSSFPSLPSPDLDGELLSYAIEVELKEEVSRIDPVVKKRASNVLKLAEENSRLTAELKALSDRLDAAERKKREAEEAEAAAAAASGTTEGDAPGADDDVPPPPPAKDDPPAPA